MCDQTKTATRQRAAKEAVKADGTASAAAPPKQKTEPRETAEAICDAVGVPRGMADKMLIVSIG